MIIYLDESGDLGWKFTAPYRKGGSSRYITIASLVVSPSKRHLPKRLVKKLYKKFNWPSDSEKKWSDMSVEERIFFAKKAAVLREEHPQDIRYISITVRKENVQPYIRRDANKLYNYMISLSLLDEMARHEDVLFVPDPRSVKVESGNSLHDYLQTQLWFEQQTSTILTTKPEDSASNLNVQFSDMLSGIVQGHFEDGNSQPWAELHHYISYKTLFF
ncbi:DUF3800 domain-containing protein [Oceanospirillum linum]|uniref:DUF3800 domain-containing protein n=1 Tax=Oceanospirillum linum TaxID=966 RepID=A0A1T1HFA7_OCELI|nr:DUF3800 domain-containing protein [Oceanospirillum linum]OOV88539.1 hypothetical protein BTA35_0203305 [Oceanospirillum linum]SEF59964.1 Protein of unknown function [Oleiphilus messinensis]SMP06855.1 Protein of unknown function [Oceanospirillum linum]